MKGMFFAHLQPDPQNPNTINVRRGIVVSAVGAEHWLLRFRGRGFDFNQVVTAADLTQFSLFDSEESQQAFLAEVIPAPAPAAQDVLPTPPIEPAAVATPVTPTKKARRRH